MSYVPPHQRSAQGLDRSAAALERRANRFKSTNGQKTKTNDTVMSELLSISRSSADDGGSALLSYKLQEQFWDWICAKEYPVSDTTKPRIGHLRKLREGIVASGRRDEFAIKVFEESAINAIQYRDWAQFSSSVHHLLGSLYMCEAPSCCPEIEYALDSVKLGMSGNARREEMLSLLILRAEVHQSAPGSRTQHPAKLRALYTPDVDSKKSRHLNLAFGVHSALSSGNWVLFERLRQDPKNTVEQSILLELCRKRIQAWTLSTMRISHKMSLSMEWMKHSLGMDIIILKDWNIKSVIDGNILWNT